MASVSETTLTIQEMQFRVVLNPANVVAHMQRDLFIVTAEGDEQFIRSFFFDDIEGDTIANFCERFATDADYRTATFTRDTDWALTNDLFLRNCFNPYYQRNPFLEQIGSLVRAYHFFKEHASEIVQQPDYQAVVQRDRAIIPDSHHPDPEIAPIIERLNRIKGIQTLASCQGVSDVVRFQGYEIMMLSPHARYSYIWFTTLAQTVLDRISAMQSPHVEYTDTIYPTLQSTGDNRAFLTAIHRCFPPSG